MTANIIPFPRAARPRTDPVTLDRPAVAGDMVVILGERVIGMMVGWVNRHPGRRAIVQARGITRYISPLRIAPIARGRPGPPNGGDAA